MRPTWDEYFMKIAEDISIMSTCLSRRVGAVAVKENRILATGFNGAPSKVAHCEDIGSCIRRARGAKSGEMLDICRAVHAEENVINQAAKNGISLDGATLYVTIKPCMLCEKHIINSGIKRVVYGGDYPNEHGLAMFKEAGVIVERYIKHE